MCWSTVDALAEVSVSTVKPFNSAWVNYQLWACICCRCGAGCIPSPPAWAWGASIVFSSGLCSCSCRFFAKRNEKGFPHIEHANLGGATGQARGYSFTLGRTRK